MNKDERIAALVVMFRYMLFQGLALSEAQDLKDGTHETKRESWAVFNTAYLATMNLDGIIDGDEAQQAAVMLAKELGWPDPKGDVAWYEALLADKAKGLSRAEILKRADDRAAQQGRPLPRQYGERPTGGTTNASVPFSQPKPDTKYI